MRALLFVLIASSLSACGSSDGEPAPRGSAVLSDEATTDTPDPEPVSELEERRARVLGSDIPIEIVTAYDDRVKDAIVHRIQRALREEVAELVPMDDPDARGSASGRCRAMLRLPQVVSYACHLDLTFGEHPGEVVSEPFVWRVSGASLREASADDLLLPGVSYEAIARAYDIDEHASVVPGADGLVFQHPVEGTLMTVPYADLGRLMNPSSILAEIPHALDSRELETRLWEDARPPETVSVLADALPLAHAALRAGRIGSANLRPADGGASLGTSSRFSPVIDAADPAPIAARFGTTVVEQPWTWPQARVRFVALHRPTRLRARAEGQPFGPMLPRRTVVAAISADLTEGRSRSEGFGEWAFAVASMELSGWLPAAVLSRDVDVALGNVDALVETLPEDVRAHALSHAAVIAVEPFVVVVAEERPGETVLGAFEQNGALRLVTRHRGTFPDVRLTYAEAARETPLLVVGWPRPGDETSAEWEVHALPAALPETPAAPLLTLTLPSSAAHARDRATISTAVTRRRVFHPIVVRGPRREQTLYTWDGGTLVAAP
jgi:hypothetical protein